MGGGDVVGLIILIITIGIIARICAGTMDKYRVSVYIQEMGGKLLSSHWAPFGRGWFGDQSDRIYNIVYLDREGNKHIAICKTSMFSGVYLTEDRVISSDSSSDSALIQQTEKVDESDSVPDKYAEMMQRNEDLEKENRLLKEELARLKQQNGI